MRPNGLNLLRTIVLAGALGMLSSHCVRPEQAAPGATIRLVPGHTFQTISGWEATADIPDTPANSPWASYYDALIGRAVSDGGINRIRLEIRSGAESRTGIIAQFIGGALGYADWKGRRYEAQNDNDDPFVIDWSGFDFAELDWHMENTVLVAREKMAARGAKLYLNLCYVSFRGGRFFQMEPEEYAELVLATYTHLQQKYGVVPDSWEVVLEPDLPDDGWTGTDMGRAIVAAAERLKAAGFTAAFVAPSVTDMRNTLPYLDEIAAVPGALEYLKEASYHRYRGASPATLAKIAARAQALGLRTSMLEWWFGKATVDVLMEDLTVGNVSAWQGRVVQGLYDVQPDGSLSPRAEMRYNMALFRAVKLGAVRIGADSDDPERFPAVAFINPDGGYAVAVRARAAGQVTVEGLPAARYRITHVVADGAGTFPATVAQQGDSLTAAIPGKGIVTFAAEPR